MKAHHSGPNSNTNPIMLGPLNQDQCNPENAQLDEMHCLTSGVWNTVCDTRKEQTKNQLSPNFITGDN